MTITCNDCRPVGTASVNLCRLHATARLNRCQNDADRCEARLGALYAALARINGVFDDPALERFGPLSTDTLADVEAIVNRALVDDEDADKEDCTACGLHTVTDDDGLCNACYEKHEQMQGGPA